MENITDPLPQEPQTADNNASAPSAPQGGVNWKKIGTIGLVVAVLAVAAYFGQNMLFKGSLFDLKDKKFTYNPTETEEFFPNDLSNDITQIHINDKDKTTSPFGKKLIANVMQGLDNAYFQGKINNFVSVALVKSGASQADTDETMKRTFETLWGNLPVDLIAANVGNETTEIKGPLLVAKSNAGKLKQLFGDIEKIQGTGTVTEFIYTLDNPGATNVFGDGIFQTLSNDGDSPHNLDGMKHMISVLNQDNVDLVASGGELKLNTSNLAEKPLTIKINDTSKADKLVYTIAADSNFAKPIGNLNVDLTKPTDPIIVKAISTNRILDWMKAGDIKLGGTMYLKFTYYSEGKQVSLEPLVVAIKTVDATVVAADPAAPAAADPAADPAAPAEPAAGSEGEGEPAAPAAADPAAPVVNETVKVKIFAGDDKDSVTNLVKEGTTEAAVNYKKAAEATTSIFKIKWDQLSPAFINASKDGATAFTMNISASSISDFNDVNNPPIQLASLNYWVQTEHIVSKAKLDELKTNFKLPASNYDLYFRVDAVRTAESGVLTAKSEVYKITFTEEDAPAIKDYTFTVINDKGQYLVPSAFVQGKENGTDTSFILSSDIFSEADVNILFSGDVDFNKYYSADVTPVKEKAQITQSMVDTAMKDQNILPDQPFYFELVALSPKKQTVGLSEVGVLRYTTTTDYQTTFPYAFAIKDLSETNTIEVDNSETAQDAIAMTVHFEVPANLKKDEIESISVVAYGDIKPLSFGQKFDEKKYDPKTIDRDNELSLTNGDITGALNNWKKVYQFDSANPVYVHVLITAKNGKVYQALNYQKVKFNVSALTAPVEPPKPAAPETVVIRAYCIGEGEEKDKFCFVQYNDFLLIGSSEVTQASIATMSEAKGDKKSNLFSKPDYQDIGEETGFIHMSEATEKSEISYLPKEIGTKSFNAKGYLLPDTTFYLQANLPSSIALDGAKPMDQKEVVRLMKENFYKYVGVETVKGFLNDYKYVQKIEQTMPDAHRIVDVILQTTKEGKLVEELSTFLALVDDKDSSHRVTEEDKGDGNEGEGEGEGEKVDNNHGGGGGGGGASGSGSSGGGGGGTKKVPKKDGAGGSVATGETAGGSGSMDLKKHILSGAPQVTLDCLEAADDATVFQDVHKDSPAYDAINFLASTASLATANATNQAIVVGYPLNKELVNLRIFKANNEISRSEFLKLALVTSCVYDIKDEAKTPKNFPDIADHWAKNIINLAYINGYISGYTNGDFGPNDSVTRAQALKILLAIKGQAMFDYDSSLYSDVQAGDWHAQIVSTAAKEGLLDGIVQFQADTFEPNKPITRAESAMLIKNMYDYLVEAEKIVSE